LDIAHPQLGGPIVLVRVNLNAHVSGAMKGFLASTGLDLTPFSRPRNL
jgi:hypothetical protein